MTNMPWERDVFKAFHNTLFKNTLVSSDWIEWWFKRTSPFTRVHTVWNNDNLVGTWCVEPKKLDDGTREISVGRCFSVGIHPDYRRRNLFVQLSEHAIAEERKLAQFEYVLGFPQVGRPVVDAHLKSGWEHVQDVDIYSFDPRTLTTMTSLNDCERMTDFRNVQRPAYVGTFINNDRYENYRWLENPDNHYITLRFRNGFIVLKTYANVCHVLDISGKHSEVQRLLDVTKTLAFRHKWEEVTIWNAANEFHHNDIVSCGFVSGAKFASSVQLLAVNINAKAPLQLPATHFMMGGEEMY